MSAKQERTRSAVSTPNTSIISLTASTAVPNSDVELGIGVQPAALPESIRLHVERFLAATGSLNTHTKSIRSRLEELLNVYAVAQQGSRTELEQALLHMQEVAQQARMDGLDMRSLLRDLTFLQSEGLKQRDCGPNSAYESISASQLGMHQRVFRQLMDKCGVVVQQLGDLAASSHKDTDKSDKSGPAPVESAKTELVAADLRESAQQVVAEVEELHQLLADMLGTLEAQAQRALRIQQGTIAEARKLMAEKGPPALPDASKPSFYCSRRCGIISGVVLLAIAIIVIATVFRLRAGPA